MNKNNIMKTTKIVKTEKGGGGVLEIVVYMG
jgi:hypothetical protein